MMMGTTCWEISFGIDDERLPRNLSAVTQSARRVNPRRLQLGVNTKKFHFDTLHTAVCDYGVDDAITLACTNKQRAHLSSHNPRVEMSHGDTEALQGHKHTTSSSSPSQHGAVRPLKCIVD